MASPGLYRIEFQQTHQRMIVNGMNRTNGPNQQQRPHADQPPPQPAAQLHEEVEELVEEGRCTKQITLEPALRTTLGNPTMGSRM